MQEPSVLALHTCVECGWCAQDTDIKRNGLFLKGIRVRGSQFVEVVSEIEGGWLIKTSEETFIANEDMFP